MNIFSEIIFCLKKIFLHLERLIPEMKIEITNAAFYIILAEIIFRSRHPLKKGFDAMCTWNDNTCKEGQYAFENYSSFEEWKKAAKPALIERLGLGHWLAMPRNPVVPESLWKHETDLGTIEKIRFETEPGESAFAYICLPKRAEKPYKTFICLQGHSTGMHNSIGVEWKDELIPKVIEGDRDFAIGCLKRGLAAVCLEQRAMGERGTSPERAPSCYEPSTAMLLYNRTMIGARIYDVDRLIDYLYTRSDLDFRTLGIMGNSGGGTTSMFAGALLDRITHVMPSCSFSSFKESIGAMYHCICNFVPGLLLYGESADVVGLAAPKPMVIVNGRFDPIFPLAAADRQFERLRRIYKAAGKEENCVHVVGEGEHRFYADIAWNAMERFL